MRHLNCKLPAAARLAALAGFLPLSVAAAAAGANLLTKIPLRFEENRGQFGKRARYAAVTGSYRLELASTEHWLTFDSKESGIHGVFAGADPKAVIEALEPLSAKTNYFIGAPQAWRTGVRNFDRLRIKSLYPGIDLVFHGSSGTLEYDFVVRPGADPRVIRCVFDGAKLSVDAGGALIISAPGGEVRWKKPIFYQEQGMAREIVAGQFEARGNAVAFRAGAYDRNRVLVIDPTLDYVSYLGSTGNEGARGIGVDAAGNVYIAGATNSNKLAVTVGAFQTAYGGESGLDTSGDVFVAKFSAAGALLYLTYLGGKQDDGASSLAVDGQGNAYITGATNSPDFPVTAGALQSKFAGFGGNACGRGGDGFVAKLNPSGSQLLYATYLGGSLDDVAGTIAIDSSGNAYVAGATLSRDFPATAGAFQTKFAGLGGQAGATFCGGAPFFNTGDAWVAKVNPTGTALVWATYLGGTLDDAATTISVDAEGSVYVAGATLSRNFPTTSGAFQTSFHGIDTQNFFFNYGDGWVAKLNSAGSGLIYSTYLGGRGDDVVFDVFVDSSGNATVTGSTSSTDFPVTPTAVQALYNGYVNLPFSIEQSMGDAFVTQLNSTGTALLYSTFLGGLENDEGTAVAVDATGLIYLVGATDSPDFRVTLDATQKTFGGDGGQEKFLRFGDGFFAIIDPKSKTPVFSTFFGGRSDDEFGGLALDNQGGVWIAGNTLSPNLPVTSGAYQPAFGGQRANLNSGKGDLLLVHYTVQALPSLASSGPVNGASFVGGGLVPGEIATIFGTNLTSATGINLTSSLPLPQQFLTVSVLVNGAPAPLFAVDNVNGQQQVNFQVPWEVANQPNVTLQEVNNGLASASLEVPILAAQPGVFNYSANGNTFGAILHANFQLADTAHPIHAGEVVLIYCTGLGAVHDPPADGAASSGETTAGTPAVTIGGKNAAVSFSGLAPQFVGLYQINAVIPSGLAAGNQQVVVKMGNVSSSPVLLPLK